MACVWWQCASQSHLPRVGNPKEDEDKPWEKWRMQKTTPCTSRQLTFLALLLQSTLYILFFFPFRRNTTCFKWHFESGLQIENCIDGRLHSKLYWSPYQVKIKVLKIWHTTEKIVVIKYIKRSFKIRKNETVLSALICCGQMRWNHTLLNPQLSLKYHNNHLGEIVAV